MNSILQHVRRTALAGLSDQDLLEAFVSRREEAAFEALLKRHGPMILAVCRRVLGNAHDAEDAFQAAFLVFVRRAASIRKREVVASWLYGVAYRTALKARAMNTRRRTREKEAAARPRPAATARDLDLDRELSALPEKYRVPVVLCELEGRPRKDAARLLGIAEGTLSSRLATARKMLAKRLHRSGSILPGAAPVVGALPAALMASTLKAAALVGMGRGATGIVSAKVIALTEGMVKAMFVSKLKVLVSVVIVLGALGVGGGRVTYAVFAEGSAASAEEQPKPPPKKGDQVPLIVDAVRAVDSALARLRVAEANLEQKRASLMQAEADYQLAKANLAVAQAALRPGAPKDSIAGSLALGKHFKYQIAFELGRRQFKDGNRIEIEEVWGTRPRIEVGGQYLVRGKYLLHDAEAVLYFHRTADTPGDGFGVDLDLQRVNVQKGKGEFTLLHGMTGTGFFHLTLVASDQQGSRTVADIYFGTGANVWREK